MKIRLWSGLLLVAASVCVSCTPAVVQRADVRMAELGLGSGPGVTEREGWKIVKLSGKPSEIGLQHGRALAAEIDDAIKAVKLELDHDGQGFDWNFYRNSAQRICIPKIPQEYHDEIMGIVKGINEKGFKYDYVDLVTYNAYMELAWNYAPEEKKRRDAAKGGGQRGKNQPKPDHCSAFIATGSTTADGKIVMAHSMWDGFLTGQRITIILDITPAKGHRFVMDCFPGYIHSGTDWFINDAGILITETTTPCEGFDEKGTPEFVRARSAAQYSENLDDVYRWFEKGNNGGYSNTWLIGDLKANEIGKLELALRNVVFSRSKQGWYSGSNIAEDAKVLREDAPGYNPNDPNNGCETRRKRWAELLTQNAGKVDAMMAKAFMGDVIDQRTGKVGASGHTLCGRADIGDGTQLHGATNAKVTTAAMASRLSFWAIASFPDHSSFSAEEWFAGKGTKDAWMKGMLHDIPRREWIEVAGR